MKESTARENHSLFWSLIIGDDSSREYFLVKSITLYAKSEKLLHFLELSLFSTL